MTGRFNFRRSSGIGRAEETVLGPGVAPSGPSPLAQSMALRKTAFVATVLLLAVSTSGIAVRELVLARPVGATGYLEPVSTAQLNFTASGAVARVLVQPGDTVHAGQVLAEQDAGALQLQVAADQATLAADQAVLQYDQNPLQPPEVQALTLAVGAAQAQLAAARTKALDVASFDNTRVASLTAELEAAQATLTSDEKQAALVGPTCSALGAPDPSTGSSPSGLSQSGVNVGPLPGAGSAGVQSTNAVPGWPGTAGAARANATPAGSGTTPAAPPATTTTTVAGAPTTPVTFPPFSTPSPSDGSAALIAQCSQLIHQLSQDQGQMIQAYDALQQGLSTRQLDQDTNSSAVALAQSNVSVAVNKEVVGLLPADPAAVPTARAVVAKDDATLLTDQKSLAGAVLVAPSDGVIADVGGAVGELAGPDGIRQFAASPASLPQSQTSGIQLFPAAPEQPTGQPSQYRSMVTIDSTAVHVVAQVSEDDLSRVEQHPGARVSFPSISGSLVMARLDHVDPEPVDIQGAVYFQVELSLTSVPPSLDLTRVISYGSRSTGVSSSGSSLVGLTADVTFGK